MGLRTGSGAVGEGSMGLGGWTGVPGASPLEDDSKHSDSRQQEESQGPQDGANHQGQFFREWGGQLT